jgi:DNA-binding MarR family transcriptional regulator
MPDVHRPVRSPAAAGSPAPGAPLSAEVVETSELLLELIHAAHSARDPEAPDATHAGSGGPLTPHAIRAAIHIHLRGERTIGELARGLGVSYGWASRIVTELEEAAIVRRMPDGADRRVVRVALDPGAAEVVERAYRWRGGAIDRALAPLSPEERAGVRRVLRLATNELSGPAGSPRRPPAKDRPR